jgi:hypothetical protein
MVWSSEFSVFGLCFQHVFYFAFLAIPLFLKSITARIFRVPVSRFPQLCLLLYGCA